MNVEMGIDMNVEWVFKGRDKIRFQTEQNMNNLDVDKINNQ